MATMCLVEISSNITFKMHENKPLYFYYTFHGKAIKYIQMKLTVNLRQIPRYLFTKEHIYSVFSLLGYDGDDSFCARTKTTSNRDSVRQAQERWFRRDFYNGAIESCADL